MMEICLLLIHHLTHSFPMHPFSTPWKKPFFYLRGITHTTVYDIAADGNRG